MPLTPRRATRRPEGRGIGLRASGVAAGVAGAVLLASELLHWRASHHRLGASDSREAISPADSRESTSRHQTVVVLGLRNRGTRANYLNRYRVRAALRSFDPDADTTLIVCGGPLGSTIPEADLLAAYARERGYTGAIERDTTSASTWENIANAARILDARVSDPGALVIVSNSLHAEKGRAYLHRQRPDLAARLVRGDDYRFGEILFVKPIAAVVGLRALARLRS